MNKVREIFLLSVLFLCLGYLYLYPGLNPMLKASSSIAMSDGTDPITLPFLYQEVLKVAKSAPLELLYGAIPNRVFDAPEGSAMWMSWGERFLALFASLFVPPEQIGTFVVWILLLFNALFFYLLAQKLGWQKHLSVALSVCWAFNAFTHARAKVHFAMSGLYHLPLIFLGFVLLFNAIRTPHARNKNTLLAALCFLAASMTLHYFLILTAALTPFLVVFYFYPTQVRQNLKRALALLGVAALPSLLFLTWCLTHPLPKDFTQRQAQTLPQTGSYKNERGIHPFVEIFAAKPIDYFSGDLALGERDLNPLRAHITRSIRNNPEGSNLHERSNGIRWWLWLTAGFAIFVFLKKFHSRPTEQRFYYICFILLGVAAFFLSLTPVYFGRAIGPAAWIHTIVPQFRVPNRAGIFVHFSVIMIAGFYLSGWLKEIRWPKVKKALNFPLTLPLLAIVSFPPLLNPMPLSEIQPPYKSLTGKSSEGCETGMYFPYVSGTHALFEFYYFIQKLRDTECSMLNSSDVTETNSILLKSIPLHPEVIKAVNQNKPEYNQQLKALIECIGLQWLVFDPRVDVNWSKSFCTSLNWKMTEEKVCQAQKPHSKLKNSVKNCLNP